MLGRKLSRREFLKGLAVTAGGTALAACAPQAVQPSAPQAAAPVAKAPETVRVSSWFVDESVVKMYEVIYGEQDGIEIKYEPTSWGEYHTKLMTQMVANTAPDVPMTDALFFGEYGRAGRFANLAPLIEDTPYFDKSKLLVDPWKQYGWEEELIGLDYSANCGNYTFLFLNMEMMDELGLRDELPLWDSGKFDTLTWHGYVELCQEIKKGMPDLYPVDAPVGWYDMLASAGPAEWVDGLTTTGYYETEALVNRPECVEPIQELVDFVSVHELAPPAAERKAFKGSMFDAHQTVMGQRWFYVDKEADFEIGYLQHPWYKNRWQYYGGNTWMLNKKSERIEQAWTFLSKFCSDWDIQQSMCDQYEPGVYETKKHIDAMADDNAQKIINKINVSRNPNASECSPCTEDVEWLFRSFGGRAPLELFDVMRAELDNAFLGEKTVQEAMDDVVAKMNPIIEEKL
jgi:multiple sugar transport system substrate-binding protein